MHISSVLTGGFAAAVSMLSLVQVFVDHLLVGLLLFCTVAMTGFIALGSALTAAAWRRDARAAKTLLAACTTWALWLLTPVNLLGAHLKLAIEKPRYDESVSDLLDRRVPRCLASRACQLETAPHPMLAFSWGGLLDNWSGIVYDPAEEVSDAERFKKIFGGDLLSCRPLRGGYFFCSFT